MCSVVLVSWSGLQVALNNIRILQYFAWCFNSFWFSGHCHFLLCKMPIHRSIKNVVKNYTHAEVKVREATSNDPWGPPSMVMAEIAQMSHDLLAFSEIMPMIWKRLNDHGKNWRHVYKSLILLDYLVKAGSERVVQYCMENIISIQTLKDFQHFDDGVDHGLNIREKAKQLVALLKDTDKLRNERSRATNVKNRFGISTGYAVSGKLLCFVSFSFFFALFMVFI